MTKKQQQKEIKFPAPAGKLDFETKREVLGTGIGLVPAFIKRKKNSAETESGGGGPSPGPRGASAHPPQAFPRTIDLKAEQLVPGLVKSASWEERIHKGGIDVLGRRGLAGLGSGVADRSHFVGPSAMQTGQQTLLETMRSVSVVGRERLPSSAFFHPLQNCGGMSFPEGHHVRLLEILIEEMYQVGWLDRELSLNDNYLLLTTTLPLPINGSYDLLRCNR